jgi:hypothetical protein
MKEPLLAAFIGLFFIVLVFRMIKAYLLAHRLKGPIHDVPSEADERLVSMLKNIDTPQKAKETLREISRTAGGVQSSVGRSAYLLAAGNLALNPLKRPNLAVGFYLKALRANPMCVEAIHKLQEILTAQNRRRRLEWTYWEVLARLDDSEVGEETWVACWAGLAAIYTASPKTIHRADAIRKSLAAFVTDEAGEKEIERISHIPPAASL